MIVFEALVAKELSQQSQTQRAAFRRELHDRLADFDVGIEGGDDESHGGFVMRNAPSSAAATNSLDIADGQTSGTPKIAIFSDFARGFMSGDLKLSVLSNTVYLGCVTDASFSDDKVHEVIFIEILKHVTEFDHVDPECIIISNHDEQGTQCRRGTEARGANMTR